MLQEKGAKDATDDAKEKAGDVDVDGDSAPAAEGMNYGGVIQTGKLSDYLAIVAAIAAAAAVWGAVLNSRILRCRRPVTPVPVGHHSLAPQTGQTAG